MKSFVQYRYFYLLVHVLVWCIVLFFPYLASDANNEYSIGPLPGAFFTFSGIVHMIIFYGNAYFLYPRLFNKTHWWLYFSCIVLLIFLSVKTKFYILEWWFPNASPDARTHILFPSLVAFIASVFYSIAMEKIRLEKVRKENEALQLEMELKFLRSQVNPHFLFNTITNLVSLTRKKSGQLESSLIMLSGLMRYMLYDAGKKISLQQETEYLESYIALQRLRFGQEAKIFFKVELPATEKINSIEPMLLIAFVENAFKHGIDYGDELYIDIHLSVQEGVLDFTVMNKFDQETPAGKDEVSGIGLSNVRSRLALLYPGRHKLEINTDNELFSIHLILKLLS